MKEIIDKICAERIEQEKKWGEQNYHPYKWLAILGEEVGEANRAILEDSLVDYIDEMVQIAAVAVAAIECLYREKWRSENEQDKDRVGG